VISGRHRKLTNVETGAISGRKSPTFVYVIKGTLHSLRTGTFSWRGRQYPRSGQVCRSRDDDLRVEQKRIEPVIIGRQKGKRC
jgi:hypothetical protein